MNLLILPEYPHPSNHAVVNGVFQERLPARGHVVHMLRPMAGVAGLVDVPAPWPGGSLKVYPDEPLGAVAANIARAARQARWVRRGLEALTSTPVDVVLVRNDLINLSAALGWAARRGIPVVHQVSSPDAEFLMTRGRAEPGLRGRYFRVRGWFGRQSRRRLTRRASAVLAISASMRDYLVTREGLDASRVFSFPMGVFPRTSTPADVAARREALTLPAGRTLVYSGVLDAVRQPEWMLDVFDRVRARIPGAVLLVITAQTDDRRRRFEAEVTRRGADVRVVGPVPVAEVDGYLRCADVVLAPCPPLFEYKVSSPTKTLEGLGAGVPVVGSAEIDEHADVLVGSGGGLTAPWDRDAFAEAVVALLGDPGRRARMGAAGRAWVMRHRTYDHLADYLTTILEAAHDRSLLAALPHRPEEAAGS